MKGILDRERKKPTPKVRNLRGKAKAKKSILSPKRKCKNQGTVAKRKDLLNKRVPRSRNWP